MRASFILILSFMVTFVSCGKKDSNILKGSLGAEAIEQKDFLTIPHEDNNSLIRSKLLNSIVEKDFPALVNNPDNAVKANDELSNFEISERDLKNYQQKEKNFFKVIVSYVDREEIYFIAERILLSELINRLELSPGGEGRVFKMFSTDNERTYKGGVIYLISLNHEDLMKNDQKYYKERISMTRNSIVIDSYKTATLSVNYDFYMQKVAAQNFRGTLVVRCNRDLLEAGIPCGQPCEYKRNMPSGDFEKIAQTNLSHLGFGLKYSDRVFSINELAIGKQQAGSFEVEIKSPDMVGEDFYTLELVQMPSSTYQRSAPGFDYSIMCDGQRNINGDVTLQSKVNFSMAVTLLGRGAELKKIKL